MCLHKIRVEKISLFHIKKSAVNDFWLLTVRRGGGGGGGGKHFSKTFSIFYMLNSKNRIFNPYFSIVTCPMRKRLLWIIRGLKLPSFS